MSIQTRIHMGVMNGAKCHATYGWFCDLSYVGWQETVDFTLYATRRANFWLEL